MKILSLLLLLVFTNAIAYADSFAVSKNIQGINISNADIKLIFLGKRSRWDNGQKIILCLVNENEKELDAFLRRVIGKNTRSYNRYWTKRLFSGEISMIPEKISNSEKAFKHLEDSENSICYLGKGAVKAPDNAYLLEIK